MEIYQLTIEIYIVEGLNKQPRVTGHIIFFQDYEVLNIFFHCVTDMEDHLKRNVQGAIIGQTCI